MIKILLKVELAKKDMSQRELAFRTGIRPPTISAFCNNTAKHIPIDDLDKICSVLHCSPADLIVYNEDPEREL